MKLIKKTIIVLLSIFTAAQACAFCAAAAESDPDSSAIVGDVDGDGLVTVVDATLIQKYAARLENLSSAQLAVADTTKDGSVNVKDATQIQKLVARLISSF